MQRFGPPHGSGTPNKRRSSSSFGSVLVLTASSCTTETLSRWDAARSSAQAHANSSGGAATVRTNVSIFIRLIWNEPCGLASIGATKDDKREFGRRDLKCSRRPGCSSCGEGAGLIATITIASIHRGRLDQDRACEGGDCPGKAAPATGRPADHPLRL